MVGHRDLRAGRGADQLTDWMRTPRVRRRLDALTGAVLIGFGVRLGTES